MSSSGPSRPLPFWLWPALSLVVAALCAGAVWLSLTQSQPPPTGGTLPSDGPVGRGGPVTAPADHIGQVPAATPSLRTVPDFEFTERSGKPLRRADLLGKVWVADFIFTNCSGTCPVMTSSLRSVQERCRNLPNLRLVTFTVDPERDTPARLREYAQSQGADPEKWLFVTGERGKLHSFSRDAFLLAVGEPAAGDTTPGIEAILHSQRFVLVDAEGKIAGLYQGTEQPSVEQLIADLQRMPAAGGVRAQPPATHGLTREDLPALNASLNTLSGILVLAGYFCIKRKKVAIHKTLMLSGVAVSAAFLASYLTYHFGGEARHFTGTGAIKIAYYSMLLTHVVLAAVLVPMIVTTLVFAFRNLLDKHRRLARWTFGIWMYVSVTGVIVYFSVHG